MKQSFFPVVFYVFLFPMRSKLLESSKRFVASLPCNVGDAVLSQLLLAGKWKCLDIIMLS